MPSRLVSALNSEVTIRTEDFILTSEVTCRRTTTGSESAILTPEVMCREQAEWIPPKQRMKQRHSTIRSAMVEATGQTSGGKLAANKSNTFGSGGSAFRVSPATQYHSRVLSGCNCECLLCEDGRYEGRQTQTPQDRHDLEIA